MHQFLTEFHTHQTTIPRFIQFLLSEPSLQHDPLVTDLNKNAGEIIALLQEQQSTSTKTAPSPLDLGWAYSYSLIQKEFKDEVQMLILNGEEWQFGASWAFLKQIPEFRIDKMAKKMKEIAPRLWDMLGSLLSAMKRVSKIQEPGTPDKDDENADSEYWVYVDTHSLEGIIEMIMEGKKV